MSNEYLYQQNNSLNALAVQLSLKYLAHLLQWGTATAMTAQAGQQLPLMPLACGLSAASILLKVMKTSTASAKPPLPTENPVNLRRWII